MALTYDVYLPASPKGAGVTLINSGGWKSPYDTFKVQEGDGYRFARNEEMFKADSWHVLSPRKLVLNDFIVFEVQHGSEPKFEIPELVPHLRRAVRFITHKAGDYGVESQYIEFEDTNHSPTIEQAKRGVSEALRWFKSIEGPKETGQGIERPLLRLTNPKLKFIKCILSNWSDRHRDIL